MTLDGHVLDESKKRRRTRRQEVASDIKVIESDAKEKERRPKRNSLIKGKGRRSGEGEGDDDDVTFRTVDATSSPLDSAAAAAYGLTDYISTPTPTHDDVTSPTPALKCAASPARTPPASPLSRRTLSPPASPLTKPTRLMRTALSPPNKAIAPPKKEEKGGRKEERP